MKAVYLAAWIVIGGFLIWSGNLLLNIQALWSESSELHVLRANLDNLAGAWRDLSRPGNDVLENYAVDRQRAAFAAYEARYERVYDALLAQVGGRRELESFVRALTLEWRILTDRAQEILDLAADRERLRLAKGAPEEIHARETRSAVKMARMDRAFQNGLDVLLRANELVNRGEQSVEGMQRSNFRRLYVMLLVALIASALSVELVRRTIHQREALRGVVARIHAIVNNVVDGIVTVDERGCIESINPTACAMFGYAPEEVVGQKFIRLLDPSCRGRYLGQVKTGWARGGAYLAANSLGCEALGRRSDGTSFPMELAASRVVVDGQWLLIHIVRDITERRRADEKLRLAASVFENTTEGIMITDAAGIIQSVNPAFTTITQYRADEVIGKSPRVLRSDRQEPGFYEQMWASIRKSGQWQGEIWNRRKSGEVYPQWLTVSAIKDGQGRVTNYVGVTWDISELKASDRVKEEFVATVSHELRTPLTSVLGSLGLIVGGVAGEVPERVERLVRIAYDNSERLVRLINDILDVEKMGAGKMRLSFQSLELVPLVREAAESNRAFAEQCGVSIVVRETDEDIHVVGDADRLAQVLTNLLSNAAKFSHAGDCVEVSVRRRRAAVRIAVTDHGPGIPKEIRPRVFEKFVQADASDTRRQGGTGLGLSIAKLIVEQHGGCLDFESIPGVRTTFTVDLPEFRPGMRIDQLVGDREPLEGPRHRKTA